LYVVLEYDARRGDRGYDLARVEGAAISTRHSTVPGGCRSAGAPSSERGHRREESTNVKARARGTRRGQRADRAEELFELLSHGLSEAEIQRVVACALLALDERGRDRLVARLGAETGGTLHRLLASRGEGRTTARPSPGTAKIRKEWEKAWDEWETCVVESQDEHGRYVVREHHWEEPYLDGSSLADDLEPIAARMRKLLERVMNDGLDRTLVSSPPSRTWTRRSGRDCPTGWTRRPATGAPLAPR
jgi:hypothetical protein